MATRYVFEEWIQAMKQIDIRTFNLRGSEVQKEIYNEYNNSRGEI